MKWTGKETEIAILLLRKGLNYTDIGFELNKSSGSVRNKLNEFGLKYYDFINEKRNCLQCNNEFVVTKNCEKKFCDNSCSAKFNNRLRNSIVKTCLNCEKEIKHHRHFCTKECEFIFRKNEFYIKIEAGDTTLYEKHYKDYLIKKYGDKCMKCGWCEKNNITGNVPIQLEHIDGNSDNNSLDNLKLLCPNCHSLTPTFGNLNRGNGRENRRLKRQTMRK